MRLAQRGKGCTRQVPQTRPVFWNFEARPMAATMGNPGIPANSFTIGMAAAAD